MVTIDHLLRNLTLDELQGIKDGRRHVVWALEKLAFRERTFESAATLLRRLGAAETEPRIGNNASGQFKQLYHLYLSGTEASPEKRLSVLDEGLQSDAATERELCVEALGQMLQTGHFSRMGGGEEIGSERLEDWAPKTYGDIWSFHRAAMSRLTDIAVSNDQLAERALTLLGSHIRGLLNAVPLDDVKAMVERIAAHIGIWVQAIRGVNSWLYFDRQRADKEIRDSVRVFFDELMPSDPVDLVALYTNGWPGDFHDPDTDYDQTGGDHAYAEREARRLAETISADPTILDRALQRLVTSDAKTIFAFTRRLAELAADPVALFRSALRIAESRSETANIQFFRGLIAGTDQRDSQQARDCIRVALQSPKLKNDAISLIGSGQLQPQDLQLVTSLLRSGDVDTWQCTALSYGRGLDHLPPEQIMPLLDELGQHGARGHWAVIEILSMYLHGGKQLDEALAEKLKSTLLEHGLLDDLPRPPMDGHHMEQMVKLLLMRGNLARGFVTALLRQLLSICRTRKGEVFYALDDPVRSLIAALQASHPEQVWNEASKVLTSRTWSVQFYGEHLFEPPHANHLGPGLLNGLPSYVYLDWVRKTPITRAYVVVKWLPIVITRNDGTKGWASELESYLNEFGDQPRVLDELARRLYPTSWWGSLVPQLEPILPLLESLAGNHARAEVRVWARDQITRVKKEIEENRKGDEERDAGIR